MRDFGDVELYTGKFKDVQGPISQHNPEPDQFTADNVYPLVGLDKRLYISTVPDIEKDCMHVQTLLDQAVRSGYEGLVLRTKDKWYRVKPKATADVRITGFFEQHDLKNRPKGQLGGFTTKYGNVTAFTEELRQELWDNPEQHVGKLMEVEYKELYDTGSFRYAVKFIRFRDDKEEESFDTK
jgi:DNA ligase-1